MNVSSRSWSPYWIVAAIIAGIAVLMTIEIIEESEITLTQILMELAEPTFILLAVAGVLRRRRRLVGTGIRAEEALSHSFIRLPARHQSGTETEMKNVE